MYAMFLGSEAPKRQKKKVTKGITLYLRLYNQLTNIVPIQEVEVTKSENCTIISNSKIIIINKKLTFITKQTTLTFIHRDFTFLRLLYKQKADGPVR